MEELKNIRMFLLQLRDGFQGDVGEQLFKERHVEVVKAFEIMLLDCDKIEEKLNEQSSNS